MSSISPLEYKLSQAFNPEQARLLVEAITEAYDQLVKVSDFSELKAIVKELAVTQQRTEQRVEELAVAQQRTEQRVEELTLAQQHTEQSLQKLIEEHQDTRKQLGGLAATVGYSLENQAYKALPQLLQRDFGLLVQGRLKRDYLKDQQGNELEVNIIGQALQNGKPVTIIGESKSQLSKQKIDQFIRKRLERLEGVIPTYFPIIITHMVSGSDVEEYARSKGIAVYYSYDFE
jgi:hypothetical protein